MAATPFIQIGLTPESAQVIERGRQRPAAVRSAIRQALGQGLEETASHLKLNYLSGTYNGSLRGGNPPLAVRSGALRQAVISDLDQPPFSGVVGTAQGPASAYARMLLDKGSTTIKPRNANNLWIPIADNLNASGIARYSPRWAMSQRGPKGGRLLRIFESKKGNLVAFMPAKVVRDVAGERLGLVRGETAIRVGGKFKSGKKKGKQRGLLLFVLKKSVTVKGTDALARSVQDKQQRIGELIQSAIFGAWNGDQG